MPAAILTAELMSIVMGDVGDLPYGIALDDTG